MRLGWYTFQSAFLVQNYIGVNSLRPSRSPSEDWNTFLKNHAPEIWACDFLLVIDLFFRTIYVFFIIELRSRRVVHFGVTRHSTDACVAHQLREATPSKRAPRFLIRDTDRKYGSAFEQVVKSTGIEVVRTPYRAPRANAVCERFLGSVRRECLNHMLILSEGKLYRVLKEYVVFLNKARPHQGIEQKISETNAASGKEKREGKIIAFPVLNGLHPDYRRAAGGRAYVIGHSWIFRPAQRRSSWRVSPRMC